ncbi:MAG: Gfo/Idh/MocA family oxidoreductase [Clostridiaceae bacterium]|nr:Gfo/Idh/MocA family oxidoreductase [Clostridiaceae bacterium]
MLKIAIIGCGAIGQDHIRRLINIVPGCVVTGCSDYVSELAKKTADKFGIEYFSSGEELIHSDNVDAVLIASSDESHAGYVLECIKAKKYVFCEKPLSHNVEGCEKILTEEVRFGKPLVQVGFMRRYDPGYAEMKRIIDSGELGAPLIIHAAHRNVSQPAGYTTDMAVSNSGIHELDICRWLLNEEYSHGQVLKVRQSSCSDKTYDNPQIVLLQTESGARIDVELQLSDAYGYDIQCQVVCEKGTIDLPEPTSPVIRTNARRCTPILTDWKERFVEAYDLEMIDWVEGVKRENLNGPSSWDGYAACVAAETLNQSRDSGLFVPINMQKKPAMYD